MDVQSDFRELLELFNKHKVEYLIIGAYALAHHGVPRYTGDLDLLVKPSTQNATKILTALHDFGFGSLDLKEEDFSIEGQIVQLGLPPVRVDLITSLTGVSWEDTLEGREAGDYGGVDVYFLGKMALTANKRSVGRLQDLADLEALNALKSK